MKANGRQMNQMVAQKDAILTLIGQGYLSSAYEKLLRVKARWERLGYGYKWAELCQRLNDVEDGK